MTVTPIRNENDHKNALARIEQLFDAEPGTPEGDELEVLITLVDYYEVHIPEQSGHRFRHYPDSHSAINRTLILR